MSSIPLLLCIKDSTLVSDLNNTLIIHIDLNTLSPVQKFSIGNDNIVDGMTFGFTKKKVLCIQSQDQLSALRSLINNNIRRINLHLDGSISRKTILSINNVQDLES